MSRRTQHVGILLSVSVMVGVIAIVALIGYLFIPDEEDIIQGQMDVSEYRVSSKVPGRILEIKVKEGDYVHAGDTVAILEAPEVNAQAQSATAAENAAAALSAMANKGARKEQIQGAFELWNQAKAGLDIAKKSYERINRLYEEGVMTAQKRDEVYANYQAALAREKAAKSQYDMAVNGAREEEKQAAAEQVNMAKGNVNLVKAYKKETIQIAAIDGEVSEIYPKVGELVGTGSPIMTISITEDIWGAFNIREDQLKGLKMGDEITAYVPAIEKDIKLKVFFVKDQGSYAVWKATKATGQYDLKTFEVKARPLEKLEGIRPGMSLIMKK
ncbi:MAG: HlyD family efflux transporter periplasmic adaptor subunit [Prevotellaceae bacterium]|nr:HlyD family efflux transporter periplasmic adaptor subunit [Candidatus Faecinaster equi]